MSVKIYIDQSNMVKIQYKQMHWLIVNIRCNKFPYEMNRK